MAHDLYWKIHSRGLALRLMPRPSVPRRTGVAASDNKAACPTRRLQLGTARPDIGESLLLGDKQSQPLLVNPHGPTIVGKLNMKNA
jgi:hypothetical protein